MLILLRILFGAALAWAFNGAARNAHEAPETGDLTNAFYVAVVVILAVANAIVWAPFVGNAISDPLTGTLIRGDYVEPKNRILSLARWLGRRGHRWLARCMCFCEGVRRPDRPAAFVLGLANARPGSWLEKAFAREVFRFDNAQHCMEAYQTLRRHGVDPRPHLRSEVNLLLLSADRQVREAPEAVPVPKAAETQPLKRDQRIRLFTRSTDSPDPGPAPGPGVVDSPGGTA